MSQMLAPSDTGAGIAVGAGSAVRRFWADLLLMFPLRFPALAALLARRSPPPLLFSVLFWGTLIGVHIIPTFGIFGETWRFGVWWTVVMSVVLVLIWLALPWDPAASPRHKAVAVAFPVAVILLDQTLGDSVWADSNYLIAIANGALLFGVGRGLLFSAWVLVCHFVDYLLNSMLYPLSPDDVSFMHAPSSEEIVDAFLWTAVFLPYAGFAIGVCLLYLAVLRSREETQLLLSKLALVHDDLQDAHAELNRHLQQVRELVILEERARIARDIHDTLGHHLTAINLQLEHARRLREQEPETAWEEVGETKALALEALTEVRRCVRALKPLALEERSGLGALAALSRSFEGADLEVVFDVAGTPQPLPAEVELTLYRALQGSLTNVVRHAGARRIVVSLTFGDAGVAMRVVDDGRGAPDGIVQEGFGLAVLRERAALLGGRLLAQNGANDGFVFELCVPSVEKAL